SSWDSESCTLSVAGRGPPMLAPSPNASRSRKGAMIRLNISPGCRSTSADHCSSRLRARITGRNTVLLPAGDLHEDVFEARGIDINRADVHALPCELLGHQWRQLLAAGHPHPHVRTVEAAKPLHPRQLP